MTGVFWSLVGGAPVLVTSRPEGHAAVAGVTFGAGLLHEPPEHLGVASLLAAWLTTRLGRPADRPDEQVEAAFWLGNTESSLVLSAPVDRLPGALAEADRLLAGAAAAEIDDAVRDRARAYPNGLPGWSSHLAARWPGHLPLLAALGPVALNTLDGAALAAFAARCLGSANRVYWTNEPAVADRLAVPPGDRPPPPIGPPGRRTAPGTVLQRSPGELFSTVLPDSPATRIALDLLVRGLRRRLVEFEPLAADVRVDLYGLGEGAMLVGCVADVQANPGKADAAREAALDTVLDLVDAVAEAQIAEVRRDHAAAARALHVCDASTMTTLVRWHRLRGDLPNPETIAAAHEQATDAQVRAALAVAHRQLLAAVPFDQVGQARFPLAEAIDFPPFRGRRYQDRLRPARFVECSPERLAVREVVPDGRRTRTVTRSSVDLTDIVLRVDADGQFTTLVDGQFMTASLPWPAYRREAALRAVVDAHTAGVPVARQRLDPEWSAEVAGLLRRRKRRLVLTIAPLVALVVALAVLIPLGISRNRSGPTVRQAGPGETVRLFDGGTLGPAGPPELIEHYNTYVANVYAVQLRMCGGDPHRAGGTSRGDSGPVRHTYFGVESFTLLAGEQTLRPEYDAGVRERPQPPNTELAKGECRTGWLLFRLPAPPAGEPMALRYTYQSRQIVTWRLPAAPVSPVSRPCPTRYPNDFEPRWVGCPAPEPTR